jgi:hypothetical protein
VGFRDDVFSIHGRIVGIETDNGSARQAYHPRTESHRTGKQIAIAFLSLEEEGINRILIPGNRLSE